MFDYTKAMHAENAEMSAKLRDAESRRSALEGFARGIIQAMWDGGGVDGGDIQDLAVKYGLIESTVATETDAELHDHVVPGDEMFRLAEWLRAAPAAPDPLAGTIASEAINEISKPLASCGICSRSDPMSAATTIFCTLDHENWVIRPKTHCCERFAPQEKDGSHE